MPKLTAAQPIVFQDGTMQNLFRDFLLWLEANKVGDAPIDTLGYMRKGGEWVQAPSRRNLIINGAFLINQRGGTRTPGIGVYGFDRWKGHVDGLEQVVEYDGPESAVTLSWQGGGTGSVNGTSGESPVTGSVSAGANFSVIVPSNANYVQCELGSSETGFEYSPVADEIARCHRYYQRLYIPTWNPLGMFLGNASNYGYGVPQYLPTSMRATPSMGSPAIDKVNLYNLSGGMVATACELTAAVTSESSFVLLLDANPAITDGDLFYASTRGVGGDLIFSAEL